MLGYTHPPWIMVGGKHSLKISAPQIFLFGMKSVLKILKIKIFVLFLDIMYMKESSHGLTTE